MTEATPRFTLGTTRRGFQASQSGTTPSFRRLENPTSAVALEPRVHTLEDALRELAEQSTHTTRELAQLSLEMREFKDEMREFKDEMRQQNREMNRKWGDLANKLDTLVEDLVAPSLPRLIQETLGLEVIDLSVRRKRKLPDGRVQDPASSGTRCETSRKRKLPDGRVQEFDALAVTENLVCLNSTKATLRSADVEGLIGEIDILREFFPEYRATPVVSILASLAVDEGVLRHATRAGFLVLATGDQLMEVKNPPGFIPRRW